jgi:branched-chain amino acid transport system permease protein
MSSAWQFYISTLLVYLGVDVMAVWGLNLQFGVTGVINFAFILFQAVGAYTAAVLTLGRMSPTSFQRYVGGAHWPFWLALLAAGVAGALLSVVVGLIGLRRLRADYQAMVLLVVSLIATGVVTNQIGLFNGPAGLSLVPKPLSSALSLSSLGYQWFYVGLTAVICLIVYVPVSRITGSPLGRTLRAVRDHEQAAAALGKDVASLRMVVFVIGGAIAAISGGVLVMFIGAWAPGAWLYPETFVLFTAIIVGGSGNDLGAAVGALLVPIAFLEATRFLPSFGPAGLIDALQWITVGILALVFLWFWPRGIIPERRRRFPVIASARLAPQTPERDPGRT